ncbi:MAG: GTPase HflX [bacterium]|nr:GTPase HflX [bacterium]
MKAIFGDTSSIKPSDRRSLEKLYDKQINPRLLIDSQVLKNASAAAAATGRQVGLLIERSGKVVQVIYGSKDRIYLPDLGRYRLNKSMLRRLRFIVFTPASKSDLVQQGVEITLSVNSDWQECSSRTVFAPEIPRDIITDLEKLRFDCVAVVAVGGNSEPLAASLAYLLPYSVASGKNQKAELRGWEIRIENMKSILDWEHDFRAFIEDMEKQFSALSEKSFETGKERAVLVGAYTGSRTEAESSMEEMKALADTAGLQILDSVIQQRKEIDPRTVIGKGKVEELMLHCLDLGAELLIFDGELSPGQLRNITSITELKVIDRSMLILDIFAQRAKTSEGRLQIELAQLKYSLPRLSEKDNRLSRLTGGIGGRGPGETKLEIGRRRARDRITDLERRIDEISVQRGLRRSRRKERGVPVVAIVGYTNAGKSTLLNAITKGDAFVENKLFATLDTTSRRMRFPDEREVVFADTVGFIRELPDELVNAFRATLEELADADLLLHVVDCSSVDFRQQKEVVEKTINDLGYGDKPRLLIWNKCDLPSRLEVNSILNAHGGLAVSASTREGLPQLLQEVLAKLTETFAGRDPGGALFSDELPG